MIPAIVNLSNGPSKSMNVAAGNTFSFSPGPGSIVKLIRLGIILSDDGTSGLGNFGSLPGLPNGLLIRLVLGGNNQDLTVIKTNSDLCTRFSAQHFGCAPALNSLGAQTPVGFGNSLNTFVGHMDFWGEGVLLNGLDSVDAVVQDNLAGLSVLEMTATYVIG